MSVQVNQYLMWATRLPFPKGEEGNGFYQQNEKFMDDSAFTSEVGHHKGIFCLFDGMSGDYVFVGRVLAKSKNGELLSGPLRLTEPTLLEKELVQNAVEDHFGAGDFALWLIDHHR